MTAPRVRAGMVLAVAIAVAILLRASDTARHAVSAFGGWLAWLFTVDPIASATAFLIIAVRIFDGPIARWPLWRAFWRLRLERSADWDRRGLWSAARTLSRALRWNARHAEELDVALVAALVCETDESTEMPIDGPRFQQLVRLVRGALQPINAGIVVRYLVMNRWAENQQLLERLAAYLDKFDGLDPVFAPPPLPGQPVTFADGVSALTGALVLADLSTTSPGCAERVAVWHTHVWQGRSRVAAEADPNDLRTPYARLVVPEQDEIQVIGRYNGRVPTLRAVEVRQHPGSDGAALVFVTGETDYRSTEPGPGTPTHCKKLRPQRVDQHDPRIQYLRAGSDHERLLGARLLESQGAGRRGVLLNGKIGLVSYAAPDNPCLILMQRSDQTSNAYGTLGPTAGGVVELGVPHDRRDADPFGSVDLLSGIRRELHEELGLDEADFVADLWCVFQSNNRTRTRATTRRPTPDPLTGELVATALAMGTTPLGEAEFARRRLQKSPSEGLFESTGVLFLPLGGSAGEFARNVAAGRYEPRTCQWLGTETTAGSAVADEMEQPTYVTALYASAMVHGLGETLEAFRTAFAPHPWWTLRWPSAPVACESRICRDPAELLADHGLYAGWLSALGLRSDLSALESDAGRLDGAPAVRTAP